MATAVSNNVSVYVLRERLQESLEKRQMLLKKEGLILKEAIEGLPFTENLLKNKESLYDQAFDEIFKGTEGYENLQNWKSRYLTKN